MNKLIIALDNMTQNEVKNFIKEIYSSDVKKEKITLKVNDLIADIWFEWIKNLIENLKNEWIKTDEISWMIDWKWNDIPNTLWNYLEKLVKSWIKNIEFLTIMANGWNSMIKKVIETKNKLWLKTKILAVTIFTSMNEDENFEIYEDNIKNNILRLTRLALESWIDWIVCSPNDTKMLREVYSKDFEIVTPWIRLESSQVVNDDQHRINTPLEAIKNWATSIVVWRPITQCENKIETINKILKEIENAKYKETKSEYNFESYLYNSNWEEILKYIWAIYIRPRNWKYVRLASKLLSDWYINIWVAERNFRVLENAWHEIRKDITKKNIKADLVIWAQMWSVRFSSFLAKSLFIDESIYTEKQDIIEYIWLHSVTHENMKLKRHDIELKWKKVILCEDVVTKWSTITKMIELVENGWWKVVWVVMIVNRTEKEDFEWIPLFYCYKPEPFNLYFDKNSLPSQIGTAKPLPDNAKICEKPKNSWQELVISMRK